MFKNAAASVGLDDRRFEFKIQPPEMLRAGGRCKGGAEKKEMMLQLAHPSPGGLVN